jgi:putative hydrolase of the HAD superfamily
MIQWIVFDAMGVIFEESDDILNLLVPFLHQRGFALDAENVHAIYRRASLGEISSREFWNGLGLGADYPAIENKYLDTCFRLDPHFLETAKLLSGTFSLALLSNDIAEWSAHLRRKHGLDRIFQTTLISSEVGIRKPDAGIYRILLHRLRAKPEDCVFIDDRIPNLLAAAALGITPIWLAKDNPPPIPEIPYRIQNLSELPKLVGDDGRQPSFRTPPQGGVRNR